ncbi:hypothetical protein DFQ27_005285 [Actinomortierella ambigua]|uniref:Rho-GAP domain-containing protein n=1 Tax=Actinomortierella ambigua TaxID=1343610 RepID=A0A9P6Q2D6_9FUNG|nr:hypothetical protein DFQ27_005285 [Actinomortierella ambigua]
MAQQKASFKKWWKNITGNKAAKGLFNVDLVDSIVYAGVPVHKTVDGRLRTQGYIPTIVSKCGWFLKENGLKTRGIFRVSGSAKRIADLQTLFDTPPLYGSQLDWSPYTIHDASSVLRRYLNSLPDPVITLEYYEKFRDVHRTIMDDKEKIVAYQDLMAKLPPPHSCLLMYLLDFLAMFAYHNDENLMTSKNLASVFQPGILSHPDHALSPGDYMTSASVVEFLIEHQSSFALPTPNFDEEDDEGATFGLAHSASHFTAEQSSSAPGQPSLPVEDQERIRLHPTGTSADGMGILEGLGDETLERSKTTSALRRQHSLHKGTGALSSLPGQRPTRSKSTSSGSSSQQSQLPLFPSNLLSRRRSSRVSKTQSVYSTKGLEVDDIVVVNVDTPAAVGNEVVTQDSPLSSLSPQHLSVRKVQTFPRLPQSLDGNEPEDAATGSKRAITREPSIIFETIDLQFPVPAFPDATLQAAFACPTATKDAGSRGVVDIPSVTPANDQTSTTIHPLDDATKQTSDWSTHGRFAATVEPTAHTLLPAPHPLQQEDLSGAPPRAPIRVDPPNQTAPSMGISAYNESVVKMAPVISPPRAGNRTPHRGDGPIQRTKSTPAGLTKSSGNHHSKDGNDGHGSATHSIFKGWLTGRHKDKSNKENEGMAGSKEDKKQDVGILDKQRKYRSQDIALSFSSDDPHHGTGGTVSRRDSGRGGGHHRPKDH